MSKRVIAHKCWLIREIGDGGEIIGITTLSWPYPAVRQGVYKALEESMGRKNWWLEQITEVEFETYQAFGFEEYKI